MQGVVAEEPRVWRGTAPLLGLAWKTPAHHVTEQAFPRYLDAIPYPGQSPQSLPQAPGCLATLPCSAPPAPQQERTLCQPCQPGQPSPLTAKMSSVYSSQECQEFLPSSSVQSRGGSSHKLPLLAPIPLEVNEEGRGLSRSFSSLLPSPWTQPGPWVSEISRALRASRYVPSQADVAVFEAVSGPPPADLCHALRWYNHIKSCEKEKGSLPGVKKSLGKYGPANVEDTTGSGAVESKDEDDIDLFGSNEEEESEEAKKLREERLAQYESKKAKKTALVAKSSILLDVKPWDDETDMAKLEECVRSIQADGLVWGSSKLVPVGYGIKKLQIQCVVEDDKVGTDMLEEQITAFEDYVQSMDMAAFNKI
ncbi:elongation factor 1-beta-like [Thomomys bottae]